MTRTLVKLGSLTVRYAGTGHAALDSVDLDIRAGEKLAVIGESGSGKSTLGLALAGLLPPEARLDGRIEWDQAASAPLAGRDIGFVFQDAGASLNPVLRVGEQIAEVARRHLGLNWPGAYDRAAELLDRVRLPQPRAVLRAFPHQLSGGQRQRVAIAAAIAAGPKLVIADEPTSALDTIVQARIVELLGALVAADGATLLFITHDIALASGFADRIAVLHRGKLVEVGAAPDIVNRPAAAYTAKLLSAHIDLDTPPLIEAAHS